MSFREKSAWVMMAVLGLAGLAYAWLVTAAVEGAIAPAPVAIPFVLLVTIGAVVGQVVLALSAPRQANRAADERERRVERRASSLAGFLLAAGVICALGAYLVRPDGNLLFHLVLASLIVAQLAEYAAQIFLFRRGS